MHLFSPASLLLGFGLAHVGAFNLSQPQEFVGQRNTLNNDITTTSLFTNNSSFSEKAIMTAAPHVQEFVSQNNMLTSTASTNGVSANKIIVAAIVLLVSLLARFMTTQRQHLMRLLSTTMPIDALSSLTRKLWWVQPRAKSRYPSAIAEGKTVLVTTGRQAKTLHVVRALKDVGARVVVTDIQATSASGVSMSCDAFHVVPALSGATSAEDIDKLIEQFALLLEAEKVDVVIPMCSINSALFYATAKDRLGPRFPQVKWICDSLATTLKLDNKLEFAEVCKQWGVPQPESGRVESPKDVRSIPTNEMDVVIKRVEGSMNREEEILFVDRGQNASSLKAMKCVSVVDPWQWQRRVRGEEFSAWYVAVDGKVTFSAQYKSEPDLMHFEGMLVPEDVDRVLTRLIRGMGLNGQFAFDYMREEGTGKFFVFECNPRGSSVLEVVSGTPGWGKAFFGVDMRAQAQFQRCGFFMHGNCWPVGGKRFNSYKDAFYARGDILPLLVGEMLFPLELIRCKGARGYHHVDANIGKIIVPGRSAGRNFEIFEDAAASSSLGVKALALEQVACSNDVERDTGARFSPPKMKVPALAATESLNDIGRVSARPTRVLHIFGSMSSEYYYGVSRYYIKSAWENLVAKEPESMRGEYEHVLLQGHPDGSWSLPNSPSDEDLKGATRTTLFGAMGLVSGLNIDVVIPHMFCYQGMTACRGLFGLMGLPVLGNGPDAMALSTNKWHTRAIMASAGVPVAGGQLLRRGDIPHLSPPFILKPNREDNSQGVSLYTGGDEESLQKALESAFQFDKEVVCEEFVPLGHELRIAILEDDDGEPTVALPIIEYVMDRSGEGVRTPEDKLQTDDRGVPTVPTKCRRDLPAVNVPEGVLDRCKAEAFKAHRALGCKDYSIYDIRVSPDGTPYFLEASLYCSFAETSAIVLMDAARGSTTRDLFDRLVHRCCKEHEDRRRAKLEGGAQLLGML